MSLFTVDHNVCTLDGFCAQVCSQRLIEMTEDGPVPIAEAAEKCNLCGHCLAVCPVGALSLKDMPIEESPDIDQNLTVGENEMVQMMRARRSIRSYLPEPVDDEVLTRLIDAAHYAPTGSNIQPVSFSVIRGRAGVKKLSALVIDWLREQVKTAEPAEAAKITPLLESFDTGWDRILRDAPNLVVTHGPADLYATEKACLIAASYLELAAPCFGLGACWAGYFMNAAANYPPIVDALALPRAHAVFGALMIGRPVHTYHRLPERDPVRISWL